VINVCFYNCIPAAASSSEIRDALNDKALQELICRIDCSPNADNVRQMDLSSFSCVVYSAAAIK
jgi:hypothetical protein